MFRRLLRHLQGELFVCSEYCYIALQLFYSYLKNHICFKVEHHVAAELMPG